MRERENVKSMSEQNNAQDSLCTIEDGGRYLLQLTVPLMEGRSGE